MKKIEKNNQYFRKYYGQDIKNENPLTYFFICKGLMKYIHYECLKNWLNSKVEKIFYLIQKSIEAKVISYNRKDISCEFQ